MRLTILGSAASYPGAGRACAGYLVSSEDTDILLDCGNGTLANLAGLMDPTRLSALFISHGHIDHFADLYALQAALRYSPDGPLPPLPMYLPAGLFERMGAVLSDHGRRELSQAFGAHEFVVGEPVRIGELVVTALPVDHVPDTFALVVEGDGTRLCYTSDTRLGDEVRAAARGAGVLLAEATLPPEYAGRAPHMTPAEAGTLATEAGAHTLVLTHLWPTVDRDAAAEAAAGQFGGRVIVADELDSIDID